MCVDAIFPSIPEITRVAAPGDPHGQTGDESPVEFRFPPLHTVRRKDAFLTICRLFFPVRDIYFVFVDPCAALSIWPF